MSHEELSGEKKRSYEYDLMCLGHGFRCVNVNPEEGIIDSSFASKLQYIISHMDPHLATRFLFFLISKRIFSDT